MNLNKFHHRHAELKDSGLFGFKAIQHSAAVLTVIHMLLCSGPCPVELLELHYTRGDKSLNEIKITEPTPCNIL